MISVAQLSKHELLTRIREDLLQSTLNSWLWLEGNVNCDIHLIWVHYMSAMHHVFAPSLPFKAHLKGDRLIVRGVSKKLIHKFISIFYLKIRYWFKILWIDFFSTFRSYLFMTPESLHLFTFFYCQVKCIFAKQSVTLSQLGLRL